MAGDYEYYHNISIEDLKEDFMHKPDNEINRTFIGKLIFLLNKIFKH